MLGGQHGARPPALRDTGGQCRAQPRPGLHSRGQTGAAGSGPWCVAACLTLQAAVASGSRDICGREGGGWAPGGLAGEATAASWAPQLT